MGRRTFARIGKMVLVLLVCCGVLIQVFLLGQPLPRRSEAADVFLRALVKEAERRKQERYALVRAAHADVLFSAVQGDVIGAVAAYLRFVGIREFYLPRKPIGYYVGRGTPAEFVKYPEDQEVYIDPWLPEARSVDAERKQPSH
jgi:hypothetical protein